LRLSDRFKLISTFSKPLKKWHDFLCDRSKHYRNWHYNPYHKHVHWSTLSLVTTLLISLMLNAIPEKSNAAYAFIANYDNNTIDATYAVGNQPAYYDTQSATIITPGVGDAGGAALVTGNQQLKYRLRNNLDASTGQIEMNFKMPYVSLELMILSENLMGPDICLMILLRNIIISQTTQIIVSSKQRSMVLGGKHSEV